MITSLKKKNIQYNNFSPNPFIELIIKGDNLEAGWRARASQDIKKFQAFAIFNQTQRFL